MAEFEELVSEKIQLLAQGSSTFERPVKPVRSRSQRRSVSLGEYPTHNLTEDVPPKRFELQNQLSLYESRLHALQNNDSRRLQDIEEIEQELEATKQELHARRIRQEEELRLAETTQAEINRRQSALLESPRQKSENDQTLNPEGDSSIDGLHYGDVNIRFHQLEEEKRVHMDIIKSMQKERLEFLSIIESLKHQLLEFQHEETVRLAAEHNVSTDSKTALLGKQPVNLGMSPDYDNRYTFTALQIVYLMAGTIGLYLLGTVILRQLHVF